MKICIDFDGTYTADPELWDMFIKQARERGHTVICATMRFDYEMPEVYRALEGKVDRIIYTSRRGKRAFLYETGLRAAPDVWIDDNPQWILNDFIPGR